MIPLRVEAVLAVVETFTGFAAESRPLYGTDVAALAGGALVAARHEFHFRYEPRPIQLFGEVYR